MADCEFDIYQDNLDVRRYISAAAKGVPCVDLPVGCTGELYRERIWSRLSRLSNRTRAFASFTRDGDAFGIGLMAWPALKLELHLLLQPVGYCYCGFSIHTHCLQLSASRSSAYRIECAWLQYLGRLRCFTASTYHQFPTPANPPARRPDQASLSRGTPLLSTLVPIHCATVSKHRRQSVNLTSYLYKKKVLP